MLVRLVRHSTWLLLARLGAHAALAVFTILAARRLGGSGFGEYAFLAALVASGNLLTTFGTDLFLIRALAAGGGLELVPAALVWQLLLSAICVAGVYLAAPRFGFLSPDGVLAVRTYSLALFPLAFFSVFTAALRGKQQMGVYSALNMLLATLQAAVAGVFYASGGGLIRLASLLLLVQLAAAVAAGILCRVKIPNFWRGWRFSWGGVSSLVRASASLALLGAAGILYQRLAPILLPFLLGALPTGVFSAAARMVEMAKAGHIAVFTALYPLMAQSQAGSREGLRSFRLPWLALLGAAGLGSVGLSLLAGPLVNGVMGPEYSDSVPVLKILAWMLVPYTVSTFLTLAFLSQGDAGSVTGALAAALLAQATLTLWWGPAAGPSGAAWAALAAETLQATLLSWRAVRLYQGLLFSSGGARELPDLS